MRFVSRTYRCFDLRIAFAHWALNARRPLDGVRFGPPRVGGSPSRDTRAVRTARLGWTRARLPPDPPFAHKASDAIDPTSCRNNRVAPTSCRRLIKDNDAYAILYPEDLGNEESVSMQGFGTKSSQD